MICAEKKGDNFIDLILLKLSTIFYTYKIFANFNCQTNQSILDVHMNESVIIFGYVYD